MGMRRILGSRSGIKSDRVHEVGGARVASLDCGPSQVFRALGFESACGTPSTEMLVSVDDFCDCETEELPARDGPAFVGVDLGSSASMSAAVCLLAENVTGWNRGAAFPVTPSLSRKGVG